VLVAVIVLAVAGTTLLFLAGLVAYSRRQTRRYLLITVVLGLLVGRSVVGLGTVLGAVPMTAHHLVEHGFDFLIAVLILYAVYRSGPERTTRSVSTTDD
jgi:membrane protein DedA with SNARE-associated domain